MPSGIAYASSATGWTDSDNAEGVSDDTNATFDVAPSDDSDVLFATCNPALPTTGTVNSIVVEVKRVSTEDNTFDVQVQLSKNGTDPVGDNNPNLVDPWATDFPSGSTQPYSFGLWGTTWTMAEAANITVLIAANNGSGNTASLNIDSVRVLVDYTVGADRLTMVVQPTNAAAGATISPAVVVEATDSFSQTDTSFTGAVAVAIGNNPGGGTLSGDTNNNAVTGEATFSDLSINNNGVGYTLDFTASGLTGTTSAAFNIAAVDDLMGQACL